MGPRHWPCPAGGRRSLAESRRPEGVLTSLVHMAKSLSLAPWQLSREAVSKHRCTFSLKQRTLIGEPSATSEMNVILHGIAEGGDSRFGWPRAVCGAEGSTSSPARL